MDTWTYAAGGSWVLLAIYSAGIAIAKKRNVFAWFLLTLAFGPLAVISLWFQPSLAPEE